MSDATPNAAPPPQQGEDSAKTMVVLVYALYLASFAIWVVPAVVGIILAYIKRDEVRGTIFESHFGNAILVFWVYLVGMIVAGPLCFVLIGFPLVAALSIWVIYRCVKGLVRVSDGKAYS
jgi:uncharacterized membrane protein